MSRRNLRQKPRISYYEPEEPSLDEYIYSCSASSSSEDDNQVVGKSNRKKAKNSQAAMAKKLVALPLIPSPEASCPTSPVPAPKSAAAHTSRSTTPKANSSASEAEAPSPVVHSGQTEMDRRTEEYSTSKSVCDECADFVYEYCAIHGPLLVIPDDKVPSKSPFPAYVPRAALTIPHVFLHLAPSIIPGAGLGVFTTLTLPRGVRFGPYCGVRTHQVDSMYCWQIYDRSHKRSHVVDAADGERSNWMRYVNCARNWREQNLLAYQYQGQLYYRTIKIIPRFTELMVFYGSEFANALHINLSKYNSPPGYAQKFGVPAAKKPKLDLQKDKNENLISTKLVKKGQEQIKNTENTKETRTKTIKKNTKNISKKNSSKTSPKVTKNTTCIQEKSNTQRKVKENTASLQCNIVNKDEYKCKICNYNGINGSDIKRHSLRHNSLCDKDRPYKCDICQSSFSRKGHLVTHIRTHTGEKPYKCDICQSSFSESGTLKNHIRTHTGEKPYKCGICQSSFSQKGHLDYHIRTHTGEKPYKCGICQSSFSLKHHLDYHIRTHTGEKPYKCGICQSSFGYRNVLHNHIRTHTGEKPFKCGICQSSFSQKSYLKIHIRTHTGEKPYKCDICQRSFSRKDVLESHIRTHTAF